MLSSVVSKSLTRPGPRERALLQPFVEHPEAAVVPHQNLDPIASTIAEEKQVARDGVASEALARQRRQAVNRLP